MRRNHAEPEKRQFTHRANVALACESANKINDLYPCAISLLQAFTVGSLLLSAARSDAWDYPAAPHSNTLDDYHGISVADPYRPLEDLDSAPTRAWVEAENKLTFGFLEKLPNAPGFTTS